MKLELKHLAPYLPYGLKVQTEHIEGNRIYTLEGLSAKYDRVDLDDDYGWSYIGGIKLILHPLSDFEKVICKELMIKFSTSLIIIHEIWTLIQKEKTLNQINYETYLFMCKNHVDFNNLIENNLAIDINTITQ